jgi:hypothetical protein
MRADCEHCLSLKSHCESLQRAHLVLEGKAITAELLEDLDTVQVLSFAMGTAEILMADLRDAIERHQLADHTESSRITA